MGLRGPVWRPAAVGLAGGLVAAVVTGVASSTALSSTSAVVPVGIIVAAVIAAGLVARDRDHRVEQRLVARLDEIRASARRTEVGLAETVGIATFGTMSLPYPLPLGGGWALGWDAAAVLAREIAVGRPETVVELGSGGSSLVIGLQLRRTGTGHLYTLEHDPRFADVTRRHVTALGLEPWVTVLDAPLEDQDVDGERFRWYRLPETVLALTRIDALVVDGPPQETDPGGTPRYPAIPRLGSRLAPGSIVFVDDVVRDAEQRTLARWLGDHAGWTMERLPTGHGTAIVRVGAARPS